MWDIKIQSYIFWTLSPSTTDLKMPEFKRNGYILTGVCTQQGHNWFWNVHYWWYCSMTMVKPGNSSPGHPEDRHHGTVEFLTNQEIIETIKLYQPRRHSKHRKGSRCSDCFQYVVLTHTIFYWIQVMTSHLISSDLFTQLFRFLF